jgi:hypothetical protein
MSKIEDFVMEVLNLKKQQLELQKEQIF